MSSSSHDRFLRIWMLPLLAGLLPAIGAVVAACVSMRLELVEACNPLFAGCVSVSRAARYDLPNYIFRALVLPGAALQCLTWLLCRDWLIALGAVRRLRVSFLPWLGAVAAICLVLYGTFLGTEGPAYRWLRAYGTIGYFSCTYLCLLIATGEIGKLVQEAPALRAWRLDRLLLCICVLLLLLGVINVAAIRHLDNDTKNRIENIAEWWMGIGFTLCFLALAVLWKRTHCAVRLSTTRD